MGEPSGLEKRSVSAQAHHERRRVDVGCGVHVKKVQARCDALVVQLSPGLLGELNRVSSVTEGRKE